MKNAFILGVLLFLSFGLLGQLADMQDVSMTILDEEVRNQFEFWRVEQERESHFDAWRILVVGLRDRRSLNDAIERFRRAFPELRYDWGYERPLYKLKTGIYLHRLDVKPLLYKIRSEFPASLEIKDRVSYEEYFKLRE